ncbi:TetR family transcriptional regulator [Rhodococcus erythropolis]|uniref:TetR/AcrR family transcriptional regulator n=1 Tax=Rhodococcus qingshengii TaxID=334542 RepID=UPI0009358575|nr:TetR/AcrR family transcriptional regulator [Rhodococcus qingshengii]MCZ4542184.1 TetR/AcrR family transcriptional regulator [Rhodococcus qingshengii]OKA16735.1 TetR family transcriptional regulator [Rhodococcus erythropolis]
MVAPRKRLDREQRRTQLLDIGAQLFADRSYEDVWIEEVAEIAGVSRGLMYHYFPTKRDFFAAIVERESQHLLEVTAPDATLPVREQVAAGLDAYFAYVKSHSRGVRAINVGTLSAEAGIRAIVERELEQQQIRILDALGFEGERRQLAAVVVRGWIAFVRAVCLDWLDQPSIPQEELRVICLRTLSGALGIDLET